MLLFWRIWHHRHDNVFGTGECLISVSVFFLENYLHSLKLGGDTTHPVNAKGKDLYTSNLDFLKQNDQTTIQKRYLSVFLDHRRLNLYLRVWLEWCAQRTQGFILVWAERPYVQFATVRVTGTWFAVGVTNRRERKRITSLWWKE